MPIILAVLRLEKVQKLCSFFFQNHAKIKLMLAAVILVCLNTIVMQMRFVAIQTLLNFGMMKVNSGHHSGHPNRNIRYYDSEGNDDDIGEGGEPILGELSYPNKSSAVLRDKSVERSA